MITQRFKSLTLLVLLLFPLLTLNNLDAANSEEAHQAATTQSQSVMFIENVGQFDEDARFKVSGGTHEMWLANNALWITLLEAPDEEELREPLEPFADLRSPTEDKARKGVNLKLSFVGANPQPEIEPFNLLETKMNYFLGNDPDKWRSQVPVYGGVRYKDIYPGIDLELTSENGRTVQRFVGSEGAAPHSCQAKMLHYFFII